MTTDRALTVRRVMGIENEYGIVAPALPGWTPVSCPGA